MTDAQWEVQFYGAWWPAEPRSAAIAVGNAFPVRLVDNPSAARMWDGFVSRREAEQTFRYEPTDAQVISRKMGMWPDDNGDEQ